MTPTEQGYLSLDNSNTSDSILEWLEPDLCNVNEDLVDTSIHKMQTGENASSCNKCIQQDSDLQPRPQINSKNELKEKHSECFLGVHKFRDSKYHINIIKSVRSVVHAPCNFAVPLQNELEKELDKTVRQGILAPFESYWDSANSLVIRELW